MAGHRLPRIPPGTLLEAACIHCKLGLFNQSYVLRSACWSPVSIVELFGPNSHQFSVLYGHVDDPNHSTYLHIPNSISHRIPTLHRIYSIGLGSREPHRPKVLSLAPWCLYPSQLYINSPNPIMVLTSVCSQRFLRK